MNPPVYLGYLTLINRTPSDCIVLHAQYSTETGHNKITMTLEGENWQGPSYTLMYPILGEISVGEEGSQ